MLSNRGRNEKYKKGTVPVRVAFHFFTGKPHGMPRTGTEPIERDNVVIEDKMTGREHHDS